MSSKTKKWLLVFVWMIVIFCLSNQPSDSHSLNELFFILRKAAHVAEYAVLCFLLILALKEHRLSAASILLLAVFIAFFYAVSDEYHQTLISGRQGTLNDVLIDSCGISLTAWLARRKVIK